MGQSHCGKPHPQINPRGGGGWGGGTKNEVCLTNFSSIVACRCHCCCCCFCCCRCCCCLSLLPLLILSLLLLLLLLSLLLLLLYLLLLLLRLLLWIRLVSFRCWILKNRR